MPAQLYTGRSSLTRLTVVSAARPHPATELTLAAPQQGEWYAAAFIADGDRAVSQQVTPPDSTPNFQLI